MTCVKPLVKVGKTFKKYQVSIIGEDGLKYKSRVIDFPSNSALPSG